MLFDWCKSILLVCWMIVICLVLKRLYEELLYFLPFFPRWSLKVKSSLGTSFFHVIPIFRKENELIFLKKIEIAWESIVPKLVLKIKLIRRTPQFERILLYVQPVTTAPIWPWWNLRHTRLAHQFIKQSRTGAGRHGQTYSIFVFEIVKRQIFYV